MIDQTTSSGFPFEPGLRLGGLFGAVIARDDLDAWLSGGALPDYVRRQVVRRDPMRLDTDTSRKE